MDMEVMWRYNNAHFMITSSNRNIFRVIGHSWREIRRSPLDFSHKGQSRGALMFSFPDSKLHGAKIGGKHGTCRPWWALCLPREACYQGCSAPEQAVEQTIDTPVIWDAIAPIMASLYCISLHPILNLTCMALLHHIRKCAFGMRRLSEIIDEC